MTAEGKGRTGVQAKPTDARTLHPPLRMAARTFWLRTLPVTGRIGRRRRLLPSILIVGAQRSGTTSLHRALAANPSIRPPRYGKGVHFFDAAYGKGLAWYRAHFPRAEAGVQGLETSPYYLFHPAVPDRVATDLPEARIIVLLRDPVSRAVSHYRHEFSRGYETLDMDAAFGAEAERLAPAEAAIRAAPLRPNYEHMHHSYLARGRYAEQLDRWFASVGRERVLVIDANRLFEDPGRWLVEIERFVGLPSAGTPALGHVNGYEPVEIPDALRRRLEKYYQPHDERLVELLGWSPSWR